MFIQGKSRIHGFGVFAKLGHQAGDMVCYFHSLLVVDLLT